MNAIIERINEAGSAFVQFALPMLIQSGALILILLLVDLLLRKRVRAVFRYWIWMLVLVKLVLPTSLSSPISLGRWFGDELAHVDVTSAPVPESEVPVAPNARVEVPTIASPSVAGSQSLETIRREPAFVAVEPPDRSVEPAPESATPAATPLSWQGAALLAWLVALGAILLLLLQRALFVRRLVAHAATAGGNMGDLLGHCCERMEVGRNVGLKVSAGATSPAVCGLLRPVILVPKKLAPSLSSSELRVVLLHELAHIKRRDLWLNLAQTILQILYFYNPLLWLASAMIRRAREQAVDEMVLVAMGEKARQYPQTLVNVAKLAFKRPALSLRLIGVVESKSALTGRVKHILNRPLPKTAKLDVLGLLAIVIAAAILLPMAESDTFGSWFRSKALLEFRSDDKPTGTSHRYGDMTTYSKNYTVKFRKGEELAIVAELYQVGKPMRHLGCKIFSGSERPKEFSVMLSRTFENEDKTSVEHDLKITLGDQIFRLNDVLVSTPKYFDNTIWNFFEGLEIATQKRNGETYAELENLMRFRFCPNMGSITVPRIWMPTYGAISWVDNDAYSISVKMVALSQLDDLHIDVDVHHHGAKMQMPDGTYISGESTKEQREAIAQGYLLSVRRALMREQMPLPELTAHKYYKVGEPIHIYADSMGSDKWKPRLDEIYHDGDVNPIFVLIDGKEYPFRSGFGPFSGGGRMLVIPDSLYVDEDDFHLPPGKHTFAYGWKNLDAVNPDEPDRVVHYERLATDAVEFEVVEEIPPDYYAEVYEEGWEETLRNSVETEFSDEMRKFRMWGHLLALQIQSLPFDIAFEVYAQAEGSEERFYAGRVARQANSFPYVMGCDREVDDLDWDTVGQKRWRLILVPSRKVAMRRPPIRHYYGREFMTDWVTFEKSERFEENRRRAYVRDTLDRNMPNRGGNIRADKPIDLDGLSRRRRGDADEVWPLPDGFELGWSPENGGTLRIDPNSNVRMLWLPEANASLSKVRDETRLRLAELADSRTTQINPPMGERTLLVVRSSEGRDYFVRLKKIKKTWADLSWWPARGVDDGPFGRVVDKSERPVKGATVVFYYDYDRATKKSQQRTVTSDVLGGIVLPRTEPGEWFHAWISAPGFEELELLRIEHRADGTYFPKNLVFELHRLGATTGSVIGSDGKPLAAAPLSLTTLTRYPSVDHGVLKANNLRAISDERGDFVMPDVPPGTHVLFYPWMGPSGDEEDNGKWNAFLKPGERWPSAPVAGVLAAKVVQVGEAQKLRDIVIDLSKSTCDARGKVCDSSGRPVSGAKVYLCWKIPDGTTSISGEGYEPAVTDSQGRYRLENLPPGDWHIWARHDQVGRHSDETPIRLVQGKTVHVDLKLPGRVDADPSSPSPPASIQSDAPEESFSVYVEPRSSPEQANKGIHRRAGDY